VRRAAGVGLGPLYLGSGSGITTTTTTTIAVPSPSPSPHPTHPPLPPPTTPPPGVDVAALLSRVGLTVSDTSEKVGTFAIAYAAHKALSPVRFPPTVALTPVVAKWIGKKPAAAGGEGGGKGGQ
jgi:hypothetical protein